MSIDKEIWDKLPYCNICLGSTDPNYLAYNMAMSGVVMPVVGTIGLVGNVLVVIVYTSVNLRIFSTSIYLTALAVSDFLMITTAMFLFVLEAWRNHGPLILAYIYGYGAPLIFPFGSVFQTTSVYFCVAAAVDCFISVVLPRPFKEICCTAKNAKIAVIILAVFCFVYNIPHFFELHAIECLQLINKYNVDSTGELIESKISYLSLQICPTDIRTDALYYTIYYTYMYTTFMAIGPLILLIVLNIFVVIYVIKKGTNSEESDTISLILVVFLFIFCNLTALVVNFLELTLYEKLKHIIVYLVDLSNLLVIINATANFFVYLIFGNSFRRGLSKICLNGKEKLNSMDNVGAALLWKDEETNIAPRRLSSATFTSGTMPTSSLPITPLQEAIPLNKIKLLTNNSTNELLKNTND